MSKINIFLLTPSRGDSTSFYRGWGPYGQLDRDTDNVHVCTNMGIDWNDFRPYHLAVAQRPFTFDHQRFIDQAHKNGLPVIVDYDDDMWNVQPDNPVYDTFMNRETKSIMDWSIAEADAITVSTDHLAEKIRSMNPKGEIHVIQNAVDTKMTSRYDFQRPRRKRIAWRGSNTHVLDFNQISNEIISVANKHRDWQWYFFGWRPYSIIESIQNLKVESHAIADFMARLFHLDFMVGIVPLLDNRFNRSKSDIAFLEYTMAGTLTLASSLEEFHRPGCLNFDSPEEFELIMEQIIKKPASFAENLQAAREYVLKKRTLSVVNEKRIQLIEKLTGKEVIR